MQVDNMLLEAYAQVDERESECREAQDCVGDPTPTQSDFFSWALQTFLPTPEDYGA